MKVFLSWSGELSHKIAVELRDWLPYVIQSIQPYVSSEDIDKGTRWSIDIAKELEDSSFGILCVTPQNLEAPWINFEAGALSKAFNNSNVSPFLFGLKPSDLKKSPLLQFQSTLYEKKDLLKLILSINNAVGAEKLDESKLKKTFDVWFETLKLKLDTFLPEAADPLKENENLVSGNNNGAVEEILELAREQFKLLRNPEALLPPSYLNDIIRHSSSGGINDHLIKEIEHRLQILKKALMSANADSPLSHDEVKLSLQSLEIGLFRLSNRSRRYRREISSINPE